jgi:predicted alpha/beta superfamily hydrolase
VLSRCALLPLALALTGCRSAPSPTAAAGVAPEPAASFLLPSSALGELRRVNVWLPPQYARDPTARFPVLYMPDGGLEEDFPHVTAALGAGIAGGAVRPFLVVGIENTERRRDLTGPTGVASDRRIAPRVGGSAAFRAFLRDELRPVIDARWRTTGETAIVGESLAGLFVVETLLLEPTLFDTYIAFDPSLWWNDHELVRTAAARLRAQSCAGKTLFLTAADEEGITPFVLSLADALADAPAAPSWRYVPRPDLHHGTIFRAMEAEAYRTAFAPRAR